MTTTTVDFGANAAAYAAQYAAYEAALKERRDKIERLEARLARLRAKDVPIPFWIDMLLYPIRDGLAERFPDLRFEVLGPFGMTAATSIHASPKDSDPHAFNTVGSLTFRPGNLDSGELRVVDYSKKVDHYALNTVEEMNGMNYGTVPLPETFDELCALFTESMERETA
ncbi:MAG: hypothetical protein Q8R28_18165 [Dehalococcoidia bacterium]|nr:hypothetical protein [Dehalococcoidia bacterium]